MSEASRIFSCDLHGRTVLHGRSKSLMQLNEEPIDCLICDVNMIRSEEGDIENLSVLLNSARIDIETLEAEHCDQRAFNAEKRLRGLAESRLREISRLLLRYAADCKHGRPDLAAERLDQAIILAKAAGTDGRGPTAPTQGGEG